MSCSQIDLIIDRLLKEHPNAVCELNYRSPFELLIAVILSAQCTDKRVNLVTAKLFEDYNTPQSLAEIPFEKLIEYIRPCGFFNTKARALIECSRSLMENFSGEVPKTMDELISLRGVGRKTANVVMSNAFGSDAIAVDTHVKRLANRIGLVDSQDVLKIENELMRIVPKENWSLFHHLLIHHGRYTCKAQSPMCNECSITEFCKFFISR